MADAKREVLLSPPTYSPPHQLWILMVCAGIGSYR